MPPAKKPWRIKLVCTRPHRYIDQAIDCLRGSEGIVRVSSGPGQNQFTVWVKLKARTTSEAISLAVTMVDERLRAAHLREIRYYRPHAELAT